MRNFKNCMLTIAVMLFALTGWSKEPPAEFSKPAKENANPAVNFRNNCTTAELDEDMAVNNVRARLTTGGDVWWDRNDGLYVVPRVAPGEPPVSSIFTGAVWLGGFDVGNNLKVACQTYGNSSGQSDFWPGPLTAESGTTSQDTCAKWDRFFRVKAEEVNLHLAFFAQSKDGVPYTEDQIPSGVKGWPARGNPFFAEINNFELPNTNQGLAGFWDENEDAVYNPLDGDYPLIEIRGCEEPADLPPAPDEMIFWIYNDAGNTHGQTGADQIRMEVQVQAFAYATNDEINDMTFQRYKLINRAKEDIDSTFFAMWVDPDLGCAEDDYIGCDTTRSLAYVYNSDAADGEPGIACPGGVATYETDIPALGVDYFRGPLDEFRNEIGMSSFTYYHRGGQAGILPGTDDPQAGNPSEFYNYLSGSWKDGTPFTLGGQGKGGETTINYAFPDPPNSDGWSMCSPEPTQAGEAGLPAYDRRTIQASGPFKLRPSAINELIIGVVWVPDFNYPCPDLSRLFFADDIAQSLFDNCFKINNGPDAPDVDWIELDQEIIAVFTNDTSEFISNNSFEQYAEIDVRAPEAVADEDKTYVFEGYLLYQLKGPSVTTAQLDDPEVARLIRQSDVKNGIQKIFNWSKLEDADVPVGLEQDIWVPEEQVNGADNGIQHTFRITEDVFAEGDRRLVNHRKYYFRALAYGYNEFEAFDPETGEGQRSPFIAGRRRIGERPDGQNDYYTVIPRPITDRDLNANYGDGAQITRLDGVGVGNNFVDVTPETRDAIFEGTTGGVIDYKEGRGPVNITIYDPLEVKDGTYELRFIDGNLDDDVFEAETGQWRLVNVSDPTSPIFSETTLDNLNEQIVGEFGFTITSGQTIDAGCIGSPEPCLDTPENGAIGAETEYITDGPQWFNVVPDGFSFPNPENIFEIGAVQAYNFVQTSTGEPEESFDLFQGLTNGLGGIVPYWLAVDDLTAQVITPAWKNSFNNLPLGTTPRWEFLSRLGNIDIVFTSDKEKWSRCVVIETRSQLYNGVNLPGTNEVPRAEGEAKMFDLRQARSVTKEAGPDGLPMEDTAESRDGFGWFPGYAYNVETGKRVNIFFGENSAYAEEFGNLNLYENGTPTGRDMMFNPTSQLFMPILDILGQPNAFTYVTGGQHFVYVTNDEYDGCEEIHAELSGSEINKRKVPIRINYTMMPVLNPGTRMTSYADGLIPADAVVKMRVDNPYAVETGTGEFDGYPAYQFTIDNKEAQDLNTNGIDSALAMINIVPNPYYAYSAYENGANDQVVKITNLPAKCVVTIYTLDGKFIRQYDRDEAPRSPKGSGIPGRQIVPDLNWDMKNNKGIPIASGVYLIHVDARDSGWGERTLKWFGINRQFDPARI